MTAALYADHVDGETINLGHSEPIEIRTVINLLENALGKPAKIDFRPERPEDLPVTFASLDKAERLLGYRPKVSIQDGISEFCRWFQVWHRETNR